MKMMSVFIRSSGQEKKMKNTMLIHIGYPKTGSRWLQHELFTSESNMFEPFSLNKHGHNNTIAKCFYKNSEGYLLSSFDDNLEIIQKEINSILNIPDKNFRNKIPVISSERLSGNPQSGGFDANIIAQRLKKAFPKSKILIVIREQKRFLLSYYFQYLANGGIFSLSRYLNTKYYGTRPFFSPCHLNFLPLVKKYYQLFGEGNVIVLPYEMFNTEPKLYLSRLEDFLNINIILKDNIFYMKRNKRDHFFIRYHLRFLNIFRNLIFLNLSFLFYDKYINHGLKFIFRALGQLTPKRLDEILLSKLETLINHFVTDRYIASNKELSSLINIDLSKYGYYDIEEHPKPMKVDTK